MIDREVLTRLLPRLQPANHPSTEKLTARNHISHVCATLGAHSTLEALSVAMRQGLLPRPGG